MCHILTFFGINLKLRLLVYFSFSSLPSTHTFCRFTSLEKLLLMEQIINVTELKQPQAETKSFSQTCLDSQSSTPMASQTGHDYSPVRAHTPESHHIPPPPRSQGPPPSEVRKFANPAPLGLCGFALTAFLSNGMSVFAGVSVAGENVSSALAYGGIIQVLVGMWYVSSSVE